MYEIIYENLRFINVIKEYKIRSLQKNDFMKYLLSIILLFFSIFSFAQSKDSVIYIQKKFLFISYKKQVIIPKDSITARKDSIKSVITRKQNRYKKEFLQDSLRKIVVKDTIDYPFYKPDAIRIGVDGIWALKGIFSKDLTTSYYGNTLGIDFTTDVSFKDNRYFLVADVGYGSSAPFKSSINPATGQRQNGFGYENTGTYFRVGIDYNVMRRYFNNEILFVGVRYGQSFFSHEIKYNILPDSLWNVNIPTTELSPSGRVSQSGLIANWYELVGGLKVNLWKNIFVGYTVRFMFLGNISGEKNILKRSFDSAIAVPV